MAENMPLNGICKKINCNNTRCNTKNGKRSVFCSVHYKDRYGQRKRKINPTKKTKNIYGKLKMNDGKQIIVKKKEEASESDKDDDNNQNKESINQFLEENSNKNSSSESSSESEEIDNSHNHNRKGTYKHIFFWIFIFYANFFNFCDYFLILV